MAGGLYALPHIAKASHQIIPASHGFDPGEIIELTSIYDSLTFFAAPTMLTRFVDHPADRIRALDAIRTIFYGGAPMYVEDLKRALDTIGPAAAAGLWAGRNAEHDHLPAETDAHATGHPRYEERLASVGIPRTGVEVRIVDPQGQEAPAGRDRRGQLRAATSV